jgi:glycosyltransferase involved in cell wall biosynthesis
MSVIKLQKTKALSICSDILGHQTYGSLLQDYFSRHRTLTNLDFHWWCENPLKSLKSSFYYGLLFRLPGFWFTRQNLDFRYLRVSLGYSGITRLLLEQCMSFSNYDVLHIHTQNNAYFLPDVMKKVPTVIGIDYTAALFQRDATWISKPTFLPNINLEKPVFEAAAHIVSWSDRVKRSVVEDYGIQEHKVSVIPPGIDFKRLGLAEVPAKNEQNQRPNILFVGGAFKRKGGEDLLQVFLEYFSDVASLHLVTQKAIASNHPNVHIYNNIKPYSAAWMKLYQQADLFVMPSYHEPLGQVYIEAMGFGLPVIASNLEQLTEIVTTGETGFLVSPGNHMELAQYLKLLIDNPDLRLKMGQAAHKAAIQKFDSQTNFSRLEQIFHAVAASSYTSMQ